MSITRTSVFISYSHADEKWLKLLRKHLQPLTRYQKIEIWSDVDLRKGEKWEATIRHQISQAKAAVFLISIDFLNSDFIQIHELPPLLAAAEREGATLLSVIVRHCAFNTSPLSKLQAMNSPSKPLSEMSSAKQEKIMLNVYEELYRLFPYQEKRTKIGTPHPRAKKVVEAPENVRSDDAPMYPKRLPINSSSEDSKSKKKASGISSQTKPTTTRAKKK